MKDSREIDVGPAAGGVPTAQNVRRRRALKRVSVLAAMVLGAWLVAWHFDLHHHLTTENIRALMSDAGWLGVMVYVAAFIAGNLFHVPSNIFIAAAVLAYGFIPGYFLAYCTNSVSVVVSFWFARSVGGKALTAVERPWVRRVLARLDTHPVTSVALLRMAMAGAPWLNYLLAMSGVGLRPYAIGSALGLAPHLLVLAALVAFAVENIG